MRKNRPTPDSQSVGAASIVNYMPVPQVESHLQDFDVVAANGPALIDDALRLRYQVYCVEHSYENPASFPDGRERDGYDAHPRQAILIHRPTGTSIGTVRLVLPRARQKLPIEEVLAENERAALRSLRGRTGEVSGTLSASYSVGAKVSTSIQT
jgi:N-acyl amino acid synthase of PEP-CTERM/exosortase system